MIVALDVVSILIVAALLVPCHVLFVECLTAVLFISRRQGAGASDEKTVRLGNYAGGLGGLA